MSERLESLLTQILSQLQQQTAAINAMTQSNTQLIEALSQEEIDPHAEPLTYMDGSPVHG
jgi:hypothetical protein